MDTVDILIGLVFLALAFGLIRFIRKAGFTIVPCG